MYPCVIFIDVDGTLTNEKGKIPKSTIDAIREARKKGHRIFLCTGRCKAELHPSILDIGFDGIIGSGGAYIEVANNVLRHLTFEDKDIQVLLNYFTEKEIGYYLECNHGIYVDKIYKKYLKRIIKEYKFGTENELSKFMEILMDINDFKDIHDVNKISFICTKYSYLNVYRDLNQRYSIIKNTVPILREESGEISLKGVHKADAMKMLLENINQQDACVIAFGDSENDTEMIQYADIGIAMGNATDSLKEIADEITTTVDQHGIYQSFLKHQLIDAS